MATPESNTLLMQQLFRQPAQDYADQRSQQLKILMGIAEANRAEQLRRDLAAQSVAAAAAQQKALADREDKRIAASDKRQSDNLAAAEKRQTAAAQEKERLDIENAMEVIYPQYAAEAARSGGAVKRREEFPTTRAGLGQLMAEHAQAKVAYQEKGQKLTATAVVGELDDASAELKAAQDRLAQLSKPSPQDEKLARNAAVSAVKGGIDQGNFESTKKLSKKAVSDGIAALSKGDMAVASRLLGDEAIAAYEAAFDSTLFSLPNTKAQMQERTMAAQQVQQLQSNVNRIASDLRRGAATNQYLAEELGNRRSSLQQLMTAPPPVRRRSFEEFTPAPGGSATPPPQTGTPSPTSATGGGGYGGIAGAFNALGSGLARGVDAIVDTGADIVNYAPGTLNMLIGGEKLFNEREAGRERMNAMRDLLRATPRTAFPSQPQVEPVVSTPPYLRPLIAPGAQ